MLSGTCFGHALEAASTLGNQFLAESIRGVVPNPPVLCRSLLAVVSRWCPGGAGLPAVVVVSSVVSLVVGRLSGVSWWSPAILLVCCGLVVVYWVVVVVLVVVVVVAVVAVVVGRNRHDRRSALSLLGDLHHHCERA